MLRVNSPPLRELTFSGKSERSPEWSPDGKDLAFLSDRAGSSQIYLMSYDGGESRALTSGEAVREFHWAPDGKSIAYLARESAPKSTDEQVADREEDIPRLWTIEVASGTVRQISRGSWRIDEFEWLDSERVVAVATDQPRSETWNTALYSVRVNDGSFVLFGRPNQPFGSLSFSPERTSVSIISSRQAGPIPHDLYLRGVAADTWRDATASIDRVVKEVRWQNESTPIVRVLDGFRSRLYRIAGTKPVALDLPYSVGAFDVARDGTLAFVAIGFDRLPEVFLRHGHGAAQQVSELNSSWDGIHLTDAKTFKFKSFDGLPIEAALMKPASGSATAKRPLVLLVHGGPASSFTADYFWFNAWPQLLVTRGYEVLMVNPRGSVGYGEDFVKANRADLGGADFKDLIGAVDAVLAAGETDPARLGIGGWSYGAQMSEWAIGQTHRFKAAVAGDGVFDEAAEFGTEDGPGAAADAWYFGTPWDSPDVFARNSPATYIRNATTPTLIVHGANDATNPIGQSMALYRALKHYGVECQFVTYPREKHLPVEERHQVDVMQRMIDWFDRHVK
jgi:dipeptidyl aminopeptidase/acylaminoacyl peptidase